MLTVKICGREAVRPTTRRSSTLFHELSDESVSTSSKSSCDKSNESSIIFSSQDLPAIPASSSNSCENLATTEQPLVNDHLSDDVSSDFCLRDENSNRRNGGSIINGKRKLEEEMSGVDSLPYQYLIEKDIINSKTTETSEKKSRASPSKQLDKRKLPIMMKRCEDSEKFWEAKRRTEEINLTFKSSNITDLVMEGLMFTIKQDQDSVMVVEQKTKLELDEVIFNFSIFT